LLLTKDKAVPFQCFQHLTIDNGQLGRITAQQEVAPSTAPHSTLVVFKDYGYIFEGLVFTERERIYKPGADLLGRLI